MILDDLLGITQLLSMNQGLTSQVVGSKSLQMVIAAMKLKDTCSLEENL